MGNCFSELEMHLEALGVEAGDTVLLSDGTLAVFLCLEGSEDFLCYEEGAMFALNGHRHNLLFLDSDMCRCQKRLEGEWESCDLIHVVSLCPPEQALKLIY